MDLTSALQLFELSESDLAGPVARERLDRKREDLLNTWHPHRYANLTNNPRKYMQMYKQGEEKTKEIKAAYALLIEKLDMKEG